MLLAKELDPLEAKYDTETLVFQESRDLFVARSLFAPAALCVGVRA